MNLEFFGQTLENLSENKFNKNPSSGSRVVPREPKHRRTVWKTGMTKLLVAFRNFVNTLKIGMVSLTMEIIYIC